MHIDTNSTNDILSINKKPFRKPCQPNASQFKSFKKGFLTKKTSQPSSKKLLANKTHQSNNTALLINSTTSPNSNERNENLDLSSRNKTKTLQSPLHTSQTLHKHQLSQLRTSLKSQLNHFNKLRQQLTRHEPCYLIEISWQKCFMNTETEIIISKKQIYQDFVQKQTSLYDSSEKTPSTSPILIDTSAKKKLRSNLIENRNFLLVDESIINLLKEQFGKDLCSYSDKHVQLVQIERQLVQKFEEKTCEYKLSLDLYHIVIEVELLKKDRKNDKNLVFVECFSSTKLDRLVKRLSLYFVVCSSDIRLRFNGSILPMSGCWNLVDFKVKNGDKLFMELRSPIGLWESSEQENLNIQYNESPSTSSRLCSTCLSLTPLQKCICCSCKTQYYCSKSHQKSHLFYHKRKCKVGNDSTLESMTDDVDSWSIEKQREVKCQGMTGLLNLGSTCYINSAVQCLSHTRDLAKYLISNDYLEDINEKNPIGYKGQLAKAFAELLRDMQFDKPTTHSVINPSKFRSIVSDLNSYFHGYEHHDAQEFLSFLLDGLHEDLNLIESKPYTELSDSQSRPDNVVADEYWQAHLKRNQSKIVSLFQGQYKSALVCSDCGNSSVRFDPFLTVTLPIPTPSITSLTLILIDQSMKPTRQHIPAPLNATFDWLNKYVRENIFENVEEANVLFAKVHNHRVIRQFYKGTDQCLFDSLSSNALSRVRGGNNEIQVYLVEDNNFKGRKHKNLIQLRFNFTAALNSHTNNLKSSQDEQNVNNSSSSISSVPVPPILATTRRRNSSFNDLMAFGYPYIKDFSTEELLNNSNSFFEFIETLLQNLLDTEDKSVKYVLRFQNKKTGYQEEINRDDFDQKVLLDKSMINIECTFANDQELQNYKSILQIKESEKSLNIQNIKELQKNESLYGNLSVYRCFEQFTLSEKLEGLDLWHCSLCKKHVNATKKLELWRLPQILVIHLKRFSYDNGGDNQCSGLKNSNQRLQLLMNGGNNAQQKLNTKIDFPLNGLDLTEFIGSLGIKNGDSDCGKRNLSPPLYDLYAVINHYGRMGFGHYTTFCRIDTYETEYQSQSSNSSTDDQETLTQQYEFDDSNIRPLKSKNDLKSRIVTDAAYILFYKRSS